MKSIIAIDLKRHLDQIMTDKLSVNDTLTRLTEAFFTCDIEIFKIALKLGMDPNLSLTGNHTPLTFLMRAATSGHWTDVAKLLVSKGASPDTLDPKEVPFLYSLISAGETELMSFCVDHGANLDITGAQGESLVIAAVHYKQLDCLRLLLQKGVNPNISDSDGNTAVMWAAGRSNGIGMQISFSCLKALIKYGADVDVPNKAGFTPLMAACLINEHDAVSTLLKAGATTDKVDGKGETALFKAVDANAKEIIKILIKAGVDINAVNNLGHTPVMRASSFEVLEMLVVAGADLEMRDKTGKTVLHYKAEDDQAEMVKLLIEFGASLDDRTMGGETPLQLSIRRRSYQSASVLIDVGSSLSTYNNINVGAIHEALLPWDYFSTCNIFTKLNTPYLWRELIFYTAEYRTYTHRLLSKATQSLGNVNLCTNEGVTPLMLASACGDMWAVKHLVNSGADPLIVDNGGRSALSYSARSGNDSLVRYLLHLGCDPNSEDKNNNLPIYYAAIFENEDVMLTLMVEFAFYYRSRSTSS